MVPEVSDPATILLRWWNHRMDLVQIRRESLSQCSRPPDLWAFVDQEGRSIVQSLFRLGSQVCYCNTIRAKHLLNDGVQVLQETPRVPHEWRDVWEQDAATPGDEDQHLPLRPRPAAQGETVPGLPSRGHGRAVATLGAGGGEEERRRPQTPRHGDLLLLCHPRRHGRRQPPPALPGDQGLWYCSDDWHQHLRQERAGRGGGRGGLRGGRGREWGQAAEVWNDLRAEGAGGGGRGWWEGDRHVAVRGLVQTRAAVQLSASRQLPRAHGSTHAETSAGGETYEQWETEIYVCFLLFILKIPSPHNNQKIYCCFTQIAFQSPLSPSSALFLSDRIGDTSYNFTYTNSIRPCQISTNFCQ